MIWRPKLIKKFDISNITEEQIKGAGTQFIGDIQQYPPAHSAIKIDGERLYEKARRGSATSRSPSSDSGLPSPACSKDTMPTALSTC